MLIDWWGKKLSYPPPYSGYWVYGTIKGVEGSYCISDFISPDEIAAMPEWASLGDVKDAVKLLERRGEYRADRDLYLLVDHWEDPFEFRKHDYRGDCDAYAIFMASCLERLNEDHRLIIGLYDPDGSKRKQYPNLKVNHAWNVWYDKRGGPTVVDATHGVMYSGYAPVTANDRIPWKSFDAKGNIFQHEEVWRNMRMGVWGDIDA